jgi:hypothetical protein
LLIEGKFKNVLKSPCTYSTNGMVAYKQLIHFPQKVRQLWSLFRKHPWT